MVLDEDSVYFIWCGTYTCATRRKSQEHPYHFNGYDSLQWVRFTSMGTIHFNGYDSDVLKYLLRNIRAKFPALLTRRSGIALPVLRNMLSLVVHKMGFNSFRSVLYEAHMSRAMELEACYTSAVAQFYGCGSNKIRTIESLLGSQKREFYSLEINLYGRSGALRSRFPSTAWLIALFHKVADARAEFYDRHMLLIDGLFLSGDKSYKVIKLCYMRLKFEDTSSKAFDSVFTLFNSRRQVLGQWLSVRRAR